MGHNCSTCLPLYAAVIFHMRIRNKAYYYYVGISDLHIAVCSGSLIKEGFWGEPLHDVVSALKRHVEGAHIVDLNTHVRADQDILGTKGTVDQL